MLSLYVHIPFCVRKFSYCGFYSTQYDSMVADQYLSDLQIEIKGHADLFQNREFGSVYIGGGTPTTLSSEQLSRLFAVLEEERLRFANDAEITMEANPNTVTVQGLSRLKTLGVTRLSIGVQSFSDELLAV